MPRTVTFHLPPCPDPRRHGVAQRGSEIPGAVRRPLGSVRTHASVFSRLVARAEPTQLGRYLAEDLLGDGTDRRKSMENGSARPAPARHWR